jgi:sulfite exporter TauE/SafE
VTQYVLIFLAGLAGSMHCVGMCGGFACGLGDDPRGRPATVMRHLVYNIGRVTSYCFLGAIAGQLGLMLIGHNGEATAASHAQRALAVLSGVLMVFIGLRLFGVLRGAAHPLLGAGAELLTRALRDLIKAPGAAAPLAFGVLNGFLPCPLVYAFATQAAASGGALAGTQIMLAFGLGTFPAMILMGLAGWWWRRGRTHVVAQPVHADFLRAGTPLVRIDWRVRGVRLAGVFIVVLGAITLARGLLPMSAHLH